MIENLKQMNKITNKKQNKSTGIPIACCLYKENSDLLLLKRNRRIKDFKEYDDSHAESLIIEEQKNGNYIMHDKMLVSIIPCEKCVIKIINEGIIKEIYYIGEYKDEIKKSKYLNKWYDFIKVDQFQSKSEEEYIICKKIYCKFIIYALRKYIIRDINRLVNKKMNRSISFIKVKVDKITSIYTYLSILKSISESIIDLSENKEYFIINKDMYKKWYKEKKKMIFSYGKEKQLMDYLLKYDFGIKKLI